VGTNAFGSDAGTNNDDGSYTFDGEAAQWNGGGALYTLPQPGANDTWNIEDYDFAEVSLTISGGTMGQVIRKAGASGTIDLMTYPGGNGSQYMENQTGDITFTVALAELVEGSGGRSIGFQRGRGGPSTWAITKVVYTQGATWHTITFDSDYAGAPAIDPLEVLDGRPVNYNNNNFYKMPANPSRAGYTFVRWNTADGTAFAGGTITEDIALTATWVEGVKPPVDITLELDPDEWTLPSSIYNATLADSAYDDGELTFTFKAGGASGNYIALVPLSSDQIDELLAISGPIIITIDGEITIDDTETNTRTFRFHLGDPTTGSGWNGTNTHDSAVGADSAGYLAFSKIISGLEFSYSGNKSAVTFGYLRMQIQTAPAADTDPVILTIRSITIKEKVADEDE
jgi:hypothetical protein